MMLKRRFGILIVLIILAVSAAGCGRGATGMLPQAPANSQLIKVRVYFGSGDSVDGYVRELGIESTAKVYAGGASSTPLYDAQGNVTGSFNYQRVLYMELVTDEAEQKQ